MTSSTFAKEHYCVLPGALSPALLAQVAEIAAPLIGQSARGEAVETDGVAVGTSSWYGHKRLDGILDFLRPAFERSVGEPLLPTYSFIRCYPRGTSLARHRDRPSCEVSVTLPIAGSDNAPWPIHLGRDGAAMAADLALGDALIYSGCELWHWREALAADWRLQFFLHYVRRDGPYAEWKFDKRARLGDPPAEGTASP